jgi:hypothetical protein
VTLYEYVVVDEGKTIRLAPVCPETGVLQLAPVNHWYVYGAVPPEGLAVRVTDWPLSIVGPEGVIAPADGAGFTVIWAVGEVTLGAPLEESVIA